MKYSARDAARYLRVYDNQIWYHVGRGNLAVERSEEFGPVFDEAELDRFARLHLRRRRPKRATGRQRLPVLRRRRP